MVRLISALLTILMATSLWACGDDHDDRSLIRGEEVPKPQFIEQADAICQASSEALETRLARLKPVADDGAGIGTTAPYLELYEETIRQETRRIIDIGKPSRDAGVLNEYLNIRLTAANALRSSAQAARHGDLSDFENRLAQLSEVQAGPAAQRFGFEVCGRSAPPELPAVSDRER